MKTTYDEWRLDLCEAMLRDSLYLLIAARTWLGGLDFRRAAYGCAWNSEMAVLTMKCALTLLRMQETDNAE